MFLCSGDPQAAASTRIWNLLPYTPYLPLSGGTLTGDLTISEADPNVYLTKTAAGSSAYVVGATAGFPRWSLVLGNATAETGINNAGSDFELIAYKDDSNINYTVMTASRSTGAVVFPQGATFAAFEQLQAEVAALRTEVTTLRSRLETLEARS
jgi:hypothetical protein